MGLLDIFRKLGILKSGSASYAGDVKDMPDAMVTEMYDNDSSESEEMSDSEEE